MHFKRSGLLLLLFLNTFFIRAEEFSIEKGWQFRKVGEENWLPAKVPGGIYKDLHRNGIIADPFFGTNESALGWVDSADWDYQCFFDVSQNVFSSKKKMIVFSGLDGYAEVFLNDKKILIAENSFRKWESEVTDILKSSGNKLLIRFRSDLLLAKSKLKSYPLSLPGEERVFVRKPAYKFGWDFGPKFIAGGITGKVELLAYNDWKIAEVNTLTLLNDDGSAGVKLDIKASLIENTPLSITLECKQTGERKDTGIFFTPTDPQHSLTLRIPNAKLWWPNGAGDQPLYDISVLIKDSKGNVQVIERRVGVRKVELVREIDSIGTSFFFKVNDRPIFMKGANLVPPDHFIDASSDSLWEQWVELAVKLNMNMLRVWGGGVYPPERFYKACDEKGILVWQDFMYACAMYPGDTAFLTNAKTEAEEQVRRISGHASLALWCGNNENDEGWHNWGWQKQYKMSKADSAAIWNDYLKLFHHILSDAVHDFNPNAIYLTTSPMKGWGRKESLQHGDCHYWGVWWGKEVFETYEKKIPRFMSEYGFQSVPDLQTVKSFCGNDVNAITDPAMKQHQKHPVGYETIEEYRKRYFAEPLNFSDYIEQTQQTQWIGLFTAIRAHRSNKRCMGTLLWQLNDTWPGVSWSIADHSGRMKLAAEKLKDAYSNFAVFANVENDILKLVVVFDSVATVKCELIVEEIEKGSGKVLRKSTVDRFSLTYSDVKNFTYDLMNQAEREWKIYLKSSGRVVANAVFGRE